MAPSAVAGWDGLLSHVMQALLQIMPQQSLLSKERTGALATTVQIQTPHLNASAWAVHIHITAPSISGDIQLPCPSLTTFPVPVHWPSGALPVLLQSVYTTLTSPSGPKVCLKASQTRLLWIASAHVGEGWCIPMHRACCTWNTVSLCIFPAFLDAQQPGWQISRYPLAHCLCHCGAGRSTHFLDVRSTFIFCCSWAWQLPG